MDNTTPQGSNNDANLNDKSNFIWRQIEEDLAANKNDGKVHTRYPPEPNGHLHIGHCKAIYIDAMTAKRYGGLFNLRFDDTNPAKEETEYVHGIMEDIKWLGFMWDRGPLYASEYYEDCYNFAIKLIESGDAYIDELTAEQTREYRGTLTTPGTNSPWRERPSSESLDLFKRMRNGEFPEGRYTLRAKIDMSSPNVVMRDPVIYRILYKEHHRTGNAWCVYPMYDFAHPIGDALEGITHSLCSMEFEIHRPLYDWVVEKCGFANPPRQIEFARLNVTRTIMSKRYLRRLVEESVVSGWDDPRMPTISGMRRRGYPKDALIDFVERAGISKADSVVDFELLESCVRSRLEDTASRLMAVLNPLKVTLTNWDEGRIDTVTLENHPSKPELGERTINFTKTIYIERDDFMENPPKKFFRLKPGGEVRLKGAYIIKCEEVVKDERGEVTELLCSVDLTSKSGMPGSERKIKGTLHWVSESDCVGFTARLYEPLLSSDNDSSDGAENDENTPDKKDFMKRINPESLVTLENCKGEPSLASVKATTQFIRNGYFTPDKDSSRERLIFNRTVSLKDTFRKVMENA